MNYTQAKTVADEIVTKLGYACSRIEIAGSVRREKQEDIHDVEVVAISKPMARVKFGTPTELTPLENVCKWLRSEGVMTPRFDKLNREAMGPKFKRTFWNGVPFDLFIVTPETWGVLFLIRTGNSDFSRLMVTTKSNGGALPDSGWRVKDGRLWVDGECFDTLEEKDVFECLDLPFIEPKNRTAEELQRQLLYAKQ